MTVLFLIIGLVFLVFGAEVLVRGASYLASALGMSQLVIGLTVVSFGTSAPEFAVGVNASMNGQAGIAVGNAVGSNIINILLTLGIAAIITPLVVSRQLIKLDVPVMVGVSIVAMAFAMDGNISRYEGILLFSGLGLYTIWLLIISRREQKELKRHAENDGNHGEVPKTTLRGIGLNFALLVIGLALLVLGSNWMVDSATEIARYFGISESIIGLTVVAAGTSLPEVVTAVVASLKGQRDLAVGNVVGSNIFNLLGVLGLSAIVAPTGLEVLPSVLHFDFPVMIAAAAVCLPIFFTGAMIARWEGFFLFGFWIAYTLYLILAHSHHDSLGVYTTAMVTFVIPLASVALVASFWSNVKNIKKPKAN